MSEIIPGNEVLESDAGLAKSAVKRVVMLPCPFCGAREDEDEGVDRNGWVAQDSKGCITRGPECLSCGATARSVADWNTRVISNDEYVVTITPKAT